jgi:deazaflavin-dependent oxidoreductase (nitroreductase family)
MSPLMKWFMRAPVALYRLGLGRLMTRRMLLLSHIGRKSGLTRQTVLEVVESNGENPVIVSGFGSKSDWYKNVLAHPEVRVNWAGDRFTAFARRLDGSDAAAVFERYRRDHPKAAAAIGNRLGIAIEDSPQDAAAKMPVLILERSA